ncbi:MAG: LptA/OstA family protein [Acidobacteriota bacterium]
MSAQKASAPVRFARIAATAALVIVAAAIVVRLAGRREPPSSAVPAAPPPADRVVDLQERVRQREFKDGRPVADIRGDRFFRGPDGRNHLAGAVEVVSFGPGGETASRLTAGEIVYDPGSLRFSVTGNVRVEAGGVVLLGDAFEYDKAKGLFWTKTGGRFSSASMAGSAGAVLYAETAGEVRLGGSFRVEIGAPGRPNEVLDASGDSFEYALRERRGRIDGRASISGADFRGTSETVSFFAARDELSFESAVLEGAARIVPGPKASGGGASGEVLADRIEVSFSRQPAGFSIRTSGRSSLLDRSAADRTVTVRAATIRLSFRRADGRSAWSASGGVRAEIAEAGAAVRTLEGEDAAYGSGDVVEATGAAGRPAVAESAEARIEAPEIAVAAGTGWIRASGGAACVLRKAGGRRAMGFLSQSEDVSVSCETLEARPGTSTYGFAGNVAVRQGGKAIRAAAIEAAGETGRMSGSGGVAVTLTEAPSDGKPGRAVDLGGADMAYEPSRRVLILSSRAYVRLPEAGLEASTVTAVIGRDGRTVESLTAARGVVVSKGRYVGRSEAASYDAAAGRLTLTGSPVLTDGKGGSARGAKLTFDLADDKISVENEGDGRATTVVRS